LTFVKPFITIIQLIQLGLILGHSVAALLPGCQGTKLFYLQVANGAILIGFFLKFYVESYLKRSSKKEL
jgi:GNS1/SUR4 family